MKRTMATACAWGFLTTVGLAWVSGVWAFQLETHRAVNERAVEVSNLDELLKAELGLRDGRRELLNSTRVQDWIGIGGLEEDLFLNNEGGGAYNRSRHHFQNPLLRWDRAGLNGRCFFGLFTINGQASVRWAQSDMDQAGSQARWADSRRLFLNSLTLPSKGERANAAADLFKVLGQQMHLISDLAVPAHARNDIHCTRSAENFEVWAERPINRDILKTVQPIGPDPSIFSVGVPIQDEIARVPVARLWDTEAYRVARNPDLTLSGPVGLAEYTNANFFSKRTIFSPAFPFPARTSVGPDLVAGVDPKTGNLRQYFTKARDGQTLNRLATPGAFYNYVPEALKDKNIGLDDSIFAEYASHLFPRAVGYSAALLDYFFRGKLDVTIAGDPADPQDLLLTVKNVSSETLNNGTVELYAEKSDGTRGPRPIVTQPVVSPLRTDESLAAVPFRQPDSPTRRYMAVYRGDLGGEKKDPTETGTSFVGAVIGKTAKYGGVLEELILFRTANDTFDVYFRNQFQIVLLGLREHLPVLPGYGNPAEVQWGVDSNHFFVKNYERRTVASTSVVVPVYKIFKINRPDNSVSGDEPVTATLRRTIQPPETPLPYYERHGNSSGYRTEGQYVYPVGLVMSTPYPVAYSYPSSAQEILAEDLGNGAGLEIYVLFAVPAYSEFAWFGADGGSGRGGLDVPLIIRASTGEIVYTDPLSQPYESRIQGAVDQGVHATSRFDGFATTWLVSWSDRDPRKRRWTTQMRVDDDYRPIASGHQATIYVENTVQTALVEDGQVKYDLTPKRTYVQYDPDEGASAIFYATAVVPTMSAEKWLWVDEPDVFQTYPADEGQDAEILRRTQYLVSAETGAKQRVSEWTPLPGLDGQGELVRNTQYAVAPKLRELVMLQPGFLYAHNDPVYAIPALWYGFEGARSRSVYPLGQDLTTPEEKQKFINFLSPGGQIDPGFTTFQPLTEDVDLKGKGRVKADNYPAGFQAVLDRITNSSETPDRTTIPQLSWHVVPDPDLVPARRR